MKLTTIRRTSGTMAAKIMGSLLCFMAVALPCSADTYWNFGVSGGGAGIQGFNLSIGQYYGVPEREVALIHARGIYEEELPVVFYLAQRAHVYPGYIVDLRLSGMSWMDITLYLGLSPDIYYVPVVIERYGPPFGPAYGYYHHHPRGGWTRHDLHDRDIINQVNLRFMSEHHRYAPEKIMRYRSNGRSFTDIDRYIIRDGQGRTMTRKTHAIERNDYRDSRYRQPMSRQNQNVREMTSQNQQFRTLTKPEQNRQTANRQNKQIRTMARGDDWEQLSFRQNQQARNMTRQNQQVRKSTASDDSQQNTVKQPQQLKHMARRDF